MKRFLTVLCFMLFVAFGSCQALDNTNGMVPSIIRMPVTGTELVRQDMCHLSLTNNGDWYCLSVEKNHDTSNLELHLLSKTYELDGTIFYRFDKGTMNVEPVYGDTAYTEIYQRDQFGDCIDTILVPKPEYQYSMFKLTLYTDPSSPYRRITFLFDNIN